MGRRARNPSRGPRRSCSLARVPRSHVVAITREPQVAAVGDAYRSAPQTVAVDRERWLPDLAALLATTVYELRGRMASEAPWVIGYRDAAGADAMVRALRSMGFGALHEAVAAVRVWSPVGDDVLRVAPDGLFFTPSGVTMPFAHVRRVVHASLDLELAREGVEKVVATRGNRGQPVMANVTRVRYDHNRQLAMYLFGDAGVMRLIQDHVRLPDLPGVTGRQRFERLVETVRAAAPDAAHDDRLVAHPRRRTSYSIAAMPGNQSVTSTSNHGETDLAAWLIDRALRERQL